MHSLIVVAHGSRRATSNAEVQALVERLRARLSNRFAYVKCGFLEFAEPSISAALDAAVQAGGTNIAVLPYFLARGAHIGEDIPRVILAKQVQYPAVTIELKQHIGASPGMLELLARAV